MDSQVKDVTIEKSFEKDLLAHRAFLLNFARKRCGNSTMADDLVQETILRAWQSRSQFQEGTNLRAWLCTILKNTHLNMIRKNRHETVALDETTESNAVQPADQEDRIRLSDVARAFETLSATHRQVLLSAGAGQETYETVAQRTGWQIGTVKSRLSRARMQLNKTLESATSLPARTASSPSMHLLVGAAHGEHQIAA